MTVFGVDVSHYQGTIDFNALKDSAQFVGIKAWENGQPDPLFQSNRNQCQRLGLPCWGYAFLHDSDSVDDMNACFHLLGDTVLALDWEASNCSAATVERWMDNYETALKRQGLAYYGLSPPEDATARIGQWPRWFPEYNSYSKLTPWNGEADPDWRSYYAIWQFSDRVTVDGVADPCDGNQLAPAIPVTALATWLDTNSWPPLPPLPQIPIRTAGEMQLALLMRGYSVGPSGVDGIWGPDSAAALDHYYADAR